MITFKKFGAHGRLGNQLFQYAAAMGMALRCHHDLALPAWESAQYFDAKYPALVGDGPQHIKQLDEKQFTYDEAFMSRVLTEQKVNIFGYFQSERYWRDNEKAIRASLRFKADFVYQQKRKVYQAFQKPTIAISVRRGDYVDNPNYELLPIHYYITALYKHFPEWQTKYNLLIFSDDIPYCKVHFDCVPNVFFAENNTPIEDLCLMSQCDNFILSNSTYSWWGAYLGEKKGTKVIYPAVYYRGELAKSCDTRDLWPARWKSYDHRDERIDLLDVTFTIPVTYDHRDRKKNLDLIVCMLQHHFRTNIIVGEHGGDMFRYMGEHARYVNFPKKGPFHRTMMLNVMSEFADTPLIANWDADVMVAPLQLLVTVERLRAGADMAYPYEWAFARVPRHPWFNLLERRIDIGVVGDTKFNGMNNNDAVSVGGAVLFRKASFIAGGGENQNFISFGPEDAERYHRFNALGFQIERVPGPIYHINHYVGTNSSNRHPHVNQNRAEYQKVLDMSKKELQAYVKTWGWL